MINKKLYVLVNVFGTIVDIYKTEEGGLKGLNKFTGGNYKLNEIDITPVRQTRSIRETGEETNTWTNIKKDN